MIPRPVKDIPEPAGGDLQLLRWIRSVMQGNRRLVRGAVMHAPGDVRVERRPDPAIVEPTDAIIRLAATCICGSDLWPYRGIETFDWPQPMGHEYAGIVQEIGGEVRTIEPGQFVIGSFFASDNTCEICKAGYQTSCIHREPVGAEGAQAELLRVPLADGTLVATPNVPADDLIPSLLAASDVLGTLVRRSRGRGRPGQDCRRGG
jgi:threonine dehydrogenase-like Zn-dependent dehydrogenase